MLAYRIYIQTHANSVSFVLKASVDNKYKQRMTRLVVFSTCVLIACVCIEGALIRVITPSNVFVSKHLVLCSPAPCDFNVLYSQITDAISYTLDLKLDGVIPVTNVTWADIQQITIDEVEILFPMYLPPTNILGQFYAGRLSVSTLNISSRYDAGAIAGLIRLSQSALFEEKGVVNVVSQIQYFTYDDYIVQGITTITVAQPPADILGNNNLSLFDVIPDLLYHVVFVLFGLALIGMIVWRLLPTDHKDDIQPTMPNTSYQKNPDPPNEVFYPLQGPIILKMRNDDRLTLKLF
jgi:hypothetical protein